MTAKLTTAPHVGDAKTPAQRRELANAIRVLSMDAVQKANCGHPGMPMGMADIAEVLWRDFLKHSPQHPTWADRDRFVLSNGHGSMLLYSLMHLTGYDLSLEEIKNFRQLGSKTPGHPEHEETPGVETTTGPLAQGLANAVGMAIAEKALAAQFNRDGIDIVDHYTYVFMGDGCLMEGLSHEVCSLAGTLQLGKLIGFYDDNGISIDGEVHGWFTDNTPKRFEAYGWHVVANVDGHDADAVRRAIVEARAVKDKPSLICCKTVIGYGAPNLAGKEASHGAALGEKEVDAARVKLGWSHDAFVIPPEIYAAWDGRSKGASAEKSWNEKFASYKKAHPALAAEFERRTQGELPAGWNEKSRAIVQATADKAETIATRKASQNALNALGPLLPEMIGGSADLTGSNLTMWKGSRPFGAQTPDGNYLYYGVREFGMTAIMNGITLHGGLLPYGGTFLVFSDYARNAVRMAALMKQRVIMVYSHDSIGLGEDGPTHQPIEHVATLRLIPNMSLWRPCDAVETAAAWNAAVERHDGPTCLVLTRQNVPHQNRTTQQLEQIRRGGYVLVEAAGGKPDVVLMATGSEIAIAVEAQKQLTAKGRQVRVVSMPATDVFDAQDAAYRESVLPRAITKRVAIEAGTPDFWYKYTGTEGRILGLNRFGASAPAGVLFKHFGFTAERVVQLVEEIL